MNFYLKRKTKYYNIKYSNMMVMPHRTPIVPLEIA